MAARRGVGPNLSGLSTVRAHRAEDLYTGDASDEAAARTVWATAGRDASEDAGTAALE